MISAAFWSRPIPAPGLALFRILFGLLTLIHALAFFPDSSLWFSRPGVLSGEGLATGLNLFALLGDSPAVAQALVVTLALSSVTLMAGLLPRLSSAILFLILVSLHHQNPGILNGGDLLLRLLSFFLIFAAPSDLAGEVKVSPWGWRLLQIQFTAVYVFTWLQKMASPEWRDGSAVYYTSHLQQIARWHPAWLFDTEAGIRAVTWGTLGAELLIPVLLWSGGWSRRTAILLGIFLHMGIEITMNIPLFEWTMIAGFALFLDSSDFRMLRKTHLWFHPASTNFDTV